MQNFSQGGINLKNILIKIISIITIFPLMLTLMVGCGKKKSITKEEAYKIYYDTIEKFVPELMTEPQECDIEIKTRDEVTYITEHFVRNLNIKIQSQNTDGKLQYYLLDKFPEANKMSLYCIDGENSYKISSKLNEKGILEKYHFSDIKSLLFAFLNTPLFKQDAIKSFTSKKKDTNTEITFVVDGTKMEEGFGHRVMKEILPGLNDNLDDVEIVLTIDENGTPKTMSTKISMSIFKDKDRLHAKKTLTMDFVFNKLDNVDFDLQNVISQYATNPSEFN